jgi:hypothetical protein
LVVLVDVSAVVDVSEAVWGELGVVEGVLLPVTMHEQAEDTRDGTPEHCETKVGNPVVAVWRAVVYVAQNAVTDGDWLNWRRQLSGWQSMLVDAGAELGEVVVIVIVVVIELVVSVLVGELLGAGVDEGGEGVSVATQEQADDTRDGIPWHCDT